MENASSSKKKRCSYATLLKMHCWFCAIIFSSTALIGSLSKSELSVMQQLYAAVPLIALFGLIHGADDHNKLIRLLQVPADHAPGGNGHERHRGVLMNASRLMLVSCCVYLIVMFATLAACRACAEAALLVFFTVSILHFGETAVIKPGDRAVNLAFRIASGGIPICLPMVCHHGQVVKVLSLIATQNGVVSVQMQLLLSVIVAVWGLAIMLVLLNCGYLIRLAQTAPEKLCSIFASSLLFICCQPVIAFAIYFSFYHSTQAIILYSQEYDFISPIRGMYLFAEKSWLTNAIAVAGAPILVHILFKQTCAEQFLSQTIFIGLACLSCPHLLTNSGSLRKLLGGLEPTKRYAPLEFARVRIHRPNNLERTIVNKARLNLP
jgi:Brp/Blh family beta-carotene 15,15'-monooxygenase